MSKYITDNPFRVLDIPVDCTAQEAQRAGQKWLAMLGVEMEEAAFFDTPLGPMPRTEQKVRHAMAALLDPNKRAAAAVWANEPAQVEQAAERVGPWPGALSQLGWGQ